ncbi:cysteine methyltransferase [Mycobacteroides sp. H001]|uniref:methylated-DNA--[protein]-cysteine S-methyltransferase n=1 Tax=Mycobacteroides TaxID=670516 RepID=UPI000712F696|nr:MULTISPECIES: methylated-DNA--[protein]-cysteine S-methyltransferase [Mycobacteroides]KRQ24897.1 cysteine methyltransferase [Mycobacteroides sp. H072]KRQ37788.1 cysteine methyltransferase [Mycobacteroides sp. H002]KRQ47056.1 cysteine methyltransferase [Mycobacteroides sp. H054]KRQ69292.1 cysteine methyltransferase [Mycobacteroides sp. H001]OHU37762.1 cysteine methyltransferase [Mycobacteroides chelonae]
MGPAILGSVSTVGHCFFDTAIGACAIAWSDSGVVALQLPEHDDAATLARIRRPPGSELAPPPFVAEAIDGLKRVLAGEDDDLQWVQLDLDGITDFDREVYAVTRAIGPGSTRSYGEVAAAVGAPGAAQAVGQSLGRNPIPLLVPCHRVLAADHSLHGFSAYGGVVTKRELLKLEHTPGFDDPTLF